MKPVEIFVVLLVGALTATNVSSIRYTATLDPAGVYDVAWEVEENSSVITFEVTCRTTGFVGFGISPTSSMWEADIFIGGVLGNGTAYLTDRHSIGQTGPPIDASQDVQLLSASQNETHTVLTFSRLLDTGDVDDVLIEDKNSSFIYSWGQTDQLFYHGPNRGNFDLNILNPDF